MKQDGFLSDPSHFSLDTWACGYQKGLVITIAGSQTNEQDKLEGELWTKARGKYDPCRDVPSTGQAMVLWMDTQKEQTLA